MATLALADLGELEQAFKALSSTPQYKMLRAPETGTILVQSAISGGQPFNFGEMSVTRCAVKIEGFPIGHAYVAGSVHRHAELAAVFDALLQHPQTGPDLYESVIARLAAAQQRRQSTLASEVAPTRVAFFADLGEGN
jgi:alpha-D-ribose 1-methylphosphonate 5-triphosphate synthase subunit PhnG